MKNFNSFNTQPEYLEKKNDVFGNLEYDKIGTSLDNIVDDLRNDYEEKSFVAPAGAYKVDLHDRLFFNGRYGKYTREAPISSMLQLDNGNCIVTHAGFMGLVKTDKEGKLQLADLIDMRDKDEDFNPYKGFTIGQPTANGNIPVALTVFNRGNRSSAAKDIYDNAEYRKFQKGLSRHIINYRENSR